MNGTSGFGEVRSSTSRSSTNRLLHEQLPQSEIWFLTPFLSHRTFSELQVLI